MRVAIVLIPETTGGADAAHDLAGIAEGAGWTLHVADSEHEAISRLESLSRTPMLASHANGDGGSVDSVRVDRARQRAIFLAEASTLLASSLDYGTTLRTIASLAVPYLCDWCAVDIVGDEDTVERLVLVHSDPARVDWTTEYHLPFGVADVIRSGRPTFVADVTDEITAADVLSKDQRELARTLAIGSLIVVPILLGGRDAAGAITFVAADGGRRFAVDDLAMAEELARRSAAAIENSRLYNEVREGRELLQVTLSSIGEGVVATDTAGRITFMNGVAEALTGWTLADATGLAIDEVVRIADSQSGAPYPSPADRVLEHGAVVGVSGEAVLVARDGSSTPIDECAAPILDADGTMRGIVMVFRDISERKRADAERERFNDEIARQRARLRSIVMSVPGVVWESWRDPDPTQMRTDFVSDYVETMLDYSIDEWLSTPGFWLSIVHPEDRERVERETEAMFASTEGGTSRFRWVRRDGSVIWAEAQAVVVCDSQGRPVGLRGVTLDVSSQVLAEQELRAHGERLELLNEVGRALSAELDLQMLVQTVTDAATRLCGAAYGSFFFNALEDDLPGYGQFALAGVPREAFDAHPLPHASDLFGATFSGEAPLRIDDVRNDPRYGRNSPYYGIPEGHVPVTSYLAVPVVSRSGDVLGGLFFGHPDAGVFDELDERIVISLAAQAAIAMDNARLYRAAHQEIDERRRAELEMMRARDEAEAANRAKDQFLAVLSHELRTPLTPVLAVTHVLENDERVAADQRPLIEMIRRNIELEARLIDDLLDLTRISKGKLSLTLETVDVNRLINAVVSICRDDVATKNIGLVVDLQARDHFIRADSARMQQVLWNLLKNAIKFTPSGGNISVRALNDRPGHLRLEVADSGIGIDASLLPRIFNAFDQGSVDMRQYGGLGLGLAISRSLVEMHGGVLTASSDGPGRGATFAVEIDTVVRIRIDSGRPIADGVRRAVRVLIVDDHIETSKVMKLLLERRGYIVKAAHTVNDALEATRTEDFDLLISDIGLPDGSGLDLMRSLHDRPIRGIALSGFGMEEDIARSKEAGFAEHLIKPVSFQSLQETIGRVLDS